MATTGWRSLEEVKNKKYVGLGQFYVCASQLKSEEHSLSRLMGNVPIQMLKIPEQITNARRCQQAARHTESNVAARNSVFLKPFHFSNLKNVHT
jgi:hypothetical protein